MPKRKSVLNLKAIAAQGVKIRKVDLERRAFRKLWTEKYFFIPFENKALCLICKETIAVFKEYNVSRHYRTKHAAEFDSYESIVRRQKLEKLMVGLLNKPNFLPQSSKDKQSSLNFTMPARQERCPIRTGILTVSDRCFRKEAVDVSGDNLASLIFINRFFNGEMITRDCVPDEMDKIQGSLKTWCDNMKLDLILTTGGTGFTPRDVTPEATKAVIEKEAQGLATAVIIGCLPKTPMAMLSRAVCGIRGQTLIINLPGSTKGAEECLEQVSPVIPHAIEQLREDREMVAVTHSLLHGFGDNQKSAVDVSNVAARPRKSPYPMISVEEAQAIVLREANVLDSEILDYKECLGCILADDLTATEPLPPFPASMKDGYAVLASDATGQRRVLGNSTPGTLPGKYKMEPGTCIRISTGAPVPSGADAVVQVEDTELVSKDEEGKEEVEIKILKAPVVGQDIRPIGIDIEEGLQIMVKHTKLGPGELGLIASTGTVKMAVFKRPVVAVLSTGNELVEPDKPLNPGFIRDCNKTSLLSLLKEHGFHTVDAGIAPDTPEGVKQNLKEAFQQADVVVSTGGVSMGEKDVLKQVLEKDFNATVHFARVFMKPGKPTTFATGMYNGEKKLLFGLPGNPVSAMVTSYLYLIPCLRKMMGYQNPMFTTIRAKLSNDIELDPRPEYHRASLSWPYGQAIPEAISTGSQLSSRLLSMKSCNALLVLPPRSETLERLLKGDEVDTLVIDKI